MMNGPISPARTDRVFWVFVALVVVIFLFLGIGVTFAQTVTATEHITVGSRAVGAEAEKAVPVDVITQQQIAASGYAETAQVIQALAPSFNFPRPTLRDGTDTARPATLRGLGPDQTRGEQRGVLSPIARQPELAADLSARVPACHQTGSDRCIRDRRGPRSDRAVDV